MKRFLSLCVALFIAISISACEKSFKISDSDYECLGYMPFAKYSGNIYLFTFNELTFEDIREKKDQQKQVGHIRKINTATGEIKEITSSTISPYKFFKFDNEMYFMDQNVLKVINLDNDTLKDICVLSDTTNISRMGVNGLIAFDMLEIDDYFLVNADAIYRVNKNGESIKIDNRALSIFKYNNEIFYSDESGNIIKTDKNFNNKEIILDNSRFYELNNSWINYNMGGDCKVYNIVVNNNKLYFLLFGEGCFEGRMFSMDLNTNEIKQIDTNIIKSFTIFNGKIYAIGWYQDSLCGLLRVTDEGVVDEPVCLKFSMCAMDDENIYIQHDGENFSVYGHDGKLKQEIDVEYLYE